MYEITFSNFVNDFKMFFNFWNKLIQAVYLFLDIHYNNGK